MKMKKNNDKKNYLMKVRDMYSKDGVLYYFYDWLNKIGRKKK